MAKPKITRIKASEPEKTKKTAKAAEKVVKAKKTTKTSKVVKTEKVAKAEKIVKTEKTAEGKKSFILFRPFVALFRYLKDSWGEIRQVRWPSRKVAWKMVLAVLVYTALFVVIISLLDLFFTWLFNLILGN